MASIPTRLRSTVEQRARDSCEYCLVHKDYGFFVHEVDHVIARQHGGATSIENLAFACAQCNRFKGSNIAALDPASGDIVPLFNPRTQKWDDHFCLQGPLIVPLSAFGRATVQLLQLNQVDRILLRKELLAKGCYPFQFAVR